MLGPSERRPLSPDTPPPEQKSLQAEATTCGEPRVSRLPGVLFCGGQAAFSSNHPLRRRRDYRLRPERRLGEMMGKKPKAQGARGRIIEHLTGGLRENPPDED